MKVIGIIPARFASSRFPGKPLKEIKGQSMIARVYHGSKQAKLLDEVLVATDDSRIFKHLTDLNIPVAMTLDTHMNGTERIAEIATQMTDCDYFINIQGDQPCIHPQQIDDLVQIMLDHPENKIGTLAKRIDDISVMDNPHTVKVYWNKESHLATTFERKEFPTDHSLVAKHIGIYAFQRETLMKIVQLSPTKREKTLSLEQLRWMDHGYDIVVGLTSFESPSVDVPEDIEVILQYMKENQLS